MRRYRLLFLLAALFAALTAGVSAVRDAAPYTPAVPTAPATVTAPAPTSAQQLVVTALHATPRTSPTATAQPAVKVSAPAVEVAVKVMTTDGLNIRDCPSTKCHIIGSFIKGKVLTVKMGDGWALVAEGQYVSAKYLTPTS